MDFFSKVRDNLKDPKKKALTQLGIYAIFFIFVFIVLNNSGNSSTMDYIPEETTDIVSNYEYIYKINNNDVINQITGTLKSDEDSFNYNSLNYIKKDSIIYFNNTPVTIDFDVDRYKYDKTELLIENSDSKTTYTDSSKIVYNMSANEYFTLLNEVNNCSTMDCTIINVSIAVESDTYINHVIIDLSNYYGYKYIVEINYNNINSIE
ncbi:MAG: hypothetical protein E7174_00200 [Firmicutes bacterium]|nr:hypothetical protein [Bacillota bacterium]